jgi:hypothetical protein
MHDDLITHHEVPPNSIASCEGGIEHHLTEGAVMLAFATHLLRTVPGIPEIANPEQQTREVPAVLLA